MTVICFIKYRIDPFKLDDFRLYAKNWGRIIPACGGQLIGYFMPHEGTSNIAFGLIGFDSLAGYERYRSRLRADTDAQKNFSFARDRQFILEETRTFLRAEAETLLKFPPSGDSGEQLT